METVAEMNARMDAMLKQKMEYARQQREIYDKMIKASLEKRQDKPSG